MSTYLLHQLLTHKKTLPFHLCTAQQLINNHVDRSNRSPDANHRTDLSRSRATTIDVAMHHTAEDHGFYDAKCPAGRQNDVLNTLGQIFHERVGELHEWTTHTLKREINPSTGNPRYRLKISERGSVEFCDSKDPTTPSSPFPVRSHDAANRNTSVISETAKKSCPELPSPGQDSFAVSKILKRFQPAERGQLVSPVAILRYRMLPVDICYVTVCCR